MLSLPQTAKKEGFCYQGPGVGGGGGGERGRMDIC